MFIGALRLISHLLPDAFPHHRHWKAVDTHPAYWRLAPTVDHLAPQARGGDGGDDNPVTTSMARNAARGALDLADWGWTPRPAGRLAEWDGLAGRYLDSVRARPALAARPPWQGFTAALKAALPAAYSA